jgi:hypothetical protein
MQTPSVAFYQANGARQTKTKTSKNKIHPTTKVPFFSFLLSPNITSSMKSETKNKLNMKQSMMGKNESECLHHTYLLTWEK